MNYPFPEYGPGLIVNILPGWLYVSKKIDKRLTRTNIYTYKKKICPLDYPVGIKFANRTDGNYYALFLIQQQLFEQSNSANLAGQYTGWLLKCGNGTVEYYRSNESSELCQSTIH